MEILVVLVAVTLMLGGMSVVVITSLKNAQFAKSQVQATKYAQQGMEKVKAIRDRNGTVTFSSMAPPCAPNCFFGDLKTISLPESPLYYFRIEGEGLVEKQDTFSREDLGSGIYRQIIISDAPAIPPDLPDLNQKLITVKVVWVDGSGSHESKLQTVVGAQL